MVTSTSGHYLNPNHLQDLVSRYQNSYKQAKPFPHVVIDNFLPGKVLDQLLDELSTMGSLDWQHLAEISQGQSAEGKITERKHYLPCQSQADGVTHGLLNHLNSEMFINFLEKLTSVEGLFANPQVETSGLQSFEPSHSFKIQVELNRPARALDRKLTFLIYLNKDWKEEYGGHLELWNAEMTRCEKKILPIFNRCVIFSTTDVSYYGHPEPLNCPDNETRKLLALYYYGKERSAAMPPNLSYSALPYPSH